MSPLSCAQLLLRLSLVAVLLCVIPMHSAAQNLQLDPFIGVHGGFASSNSPIEVSSNHYFPPGYSSSGSPARWGPTVGVIVDDAIEIRFEPLRTRFHFTSQSGTPFPASGSRSTSVTDGHIWQYPILVAYRPARGVLRPFLGGGLTFKRTIKGVTNTETTTVQLPTSTEITTYSTRPYTGPRSEPIAFHASMGFEFRKGFVSLRPEMRLGFWTGYQNDGENQTVFSANPLEFVVGLRIHPFKTREN